VNVLNLSNKANILNLLKDEMLLEEVGWCWGKVNQVSAGQH
jgi:hypothetical protein